MPRIPSYDQLQVSPTATPGARAEAPVYRNAAGAQMQEAGQAMQRVGGAAGQIALDIQNQANKVILDGAVSEYVKGDTNLTLEATSLRGRNALERPDKIALPDEYGKKLSDLGDKIEQGLSNDAQRAAFRHVRTQVEDRFYSRISGHMVKQQDVVQEETWKTTISTAQERGMLLYGDETERQTSLAAIRATVDEMGAKLGLDQASRDRLYTEQTSPMHAGIIKSLIAGDNPEAAKAYYDANSAGMTMQARASVQAHIVEATATKAGESAVDEVWAAMGPQASTDAVKLFDMDKQLREALADQPGALKHARAALRERATLFNQQQAEDQAAAINGVYALVNEGRPMAQVRKSDEWRALPAKMQDQILDDLRQDAWVEEQRGYAMQNAREKAFLRNSDEYLTLTDPAVLGRMSRGQVEALRPRFGSEATQHLLKQYDNLKKPGARAEAKMDTDDFNAVARQFGLDPLSKNKADKEQLGELKFRIEQLIDRAPNPLTRQEKLDMVRQEMAKNVLVERSWGRDREVPVINLTADQIENVSVPAADRATIAAKMQARYQKTQDPRFAPTEENLRYWYLRSLSPAADLIQPKAEQ